MVKKAVIAVVVIVVVAVVAVGAYFALSGGNDKDPNDVTFLIQDEKGVYFWISGNGETTLDALEDALSDYPSGTLTANSRGGISTLFGLGTQQVGVNYIYWVQFTWTNNEWEFSNLMMNNVPSNTVDYMLVVYAVSSMDGVDVPEGTPTPGDAKVWDGSTNGTVFHIKSETGLYFKINGTGGSTLLETFKNACEKYKIPLKTAHNTYNASDYLQGIFDILASDEDGDGVWSYWAEYEYKSGAWESSNIGMGGLKSSDNPQYALMFGDGTEIPT